MLKNKIYIYLITAGYIYINEKCWTLDKPMASMSTCHLELVVLGGNLVKNKLSSLKKPMPTIIHGILATEKHQTSTSHRHSAVSRYTLCSRPLGGGREGGGRGPLNTLSVYHL